MKKLLFIILFAITGLCLFAGEKKIPERPLNIPEEAKWYSFYWYYACPELGSYYLRWYPDGKLMTLFYKLEGTEYRVFEDYHKNGKIKKIVRNISAACLGYPQKVKNGTDSINIAGMFDYYDSGILKEKKCYTPVLHKNGTVESVLCGSEIYYDESGKEIKRIEHDVKCEYGCDDKPRLSADQVSGIIASQIQKNKVTSLRINPVVGEIVFVDSSSKEIKIAYKPGFELRIGDQVCCIIDGEIVSFECKSNDKGTGTYTLKEDKTSKLPLVSTSSEPRFYKANEVKYTDVLKSVKNPKAGDEITIAGIDFVYIPAGSFLLRDYEYPVRNRMVNINAFWMTKYEITLGEFLKYCYDGKFIGLPENKTDVNFNSNLPALLGKHHNFAWSFCSWFGNKHGIKTELPSLKEWEYAARGGTDSNFYWGNGNVNDYCWYSKNSGGRIHPVGQKKPNAYGLYDIIGNAWEWCDFWTLRGGSFRSGLSDLQYSSRYDINYEHMDSLSDLSYKSITDQGTGFRMIIRVTE